MRGLFKNEYIKVFGQNSYRVLLIIFAVFLIATPFVNLLQKNVFSVTETLEQKYDRFVGNAQYYADMDMPLEEKYWQHYAEATKYFIDNDLEDWKGNYLLEGNVASFFPEFANNSNSAYSYSEYYIRAKAFKMLVSGEHTAQELYNSAYYSQLYDYFSTDDYYFDGEHWYHHVEGTEVECPHTQEDVIAMRDKAQADLEKLSALVIECNANDIIADYRDHSKKTLDDAIDHSKSLKDSNASERDILIAENSVKYYTAVYEAFVSISENCTSLDDWRYKFGVNLITYDSLLSAYTEFPVDEQYFIDNKAYEFSSYDSYAEYRYTVNEKRENASEALEIARYAIINNIPPEGFDSTVKKDLRANIESISGFVTIFSIVLAGMIVASEFSSGSMRLLLIRPKKRWKILFSKLFCVFSLHIGLIVISTVVLFIVGAVTGAGGDAFTPDLAYIGGEVREIPSIVETLYAIGLILLQTLPVVTLAFMLSVIAKKSALALVASFVLHSFSGAAQLISILLVEDHEWLRFTILPYLSISSFRQTAVDTLLGDIGTGSFDFSSLIGALEITPASMGLELSSGIAIILLHVALMIFISFACFNKQEIKN